MNIGTKLIFLLTLSVGAVMLLASFLFLSQREAALEETLVSELRAHAVTLQITLEQTYAERGGDDEKAQILIDRLRDNSRVYAILLFDERGAVLKISKPETDPVFQKLPEIAEVIRTGETAQAFRSVGGERYVSVIKSVNLSGGRRGALELVKPLDLIEKNIFDARLNWLVITVFLLAIIFLVVTIVLRTSLSKPLEKLLKGAEKLGEGNLDFRIGAKKNGNNELSLLAAKFDQMAENLAARDFQSAKETEKRLRLERELRHSERLAAVGRFAAGVAHELGAPLNVIDARAAQILENDEIAPEKRTKNLEIIRRQSERITNIVRQLLTLARPFNFNVRTVNLNAHLTEIVEELNFNDENIKVKFSAERIFQTEADADFLQQVWINILQNARQSIKDKNFSGGMIEIELKEVKRGGKNFVAVKFTDNGGGIVPENMDKIFDPFYTTKDIGQGTGLGLAVAYRIIEEHGGTIEAANTENGGAVFTVFLPLKKWLLID